MGGEGTLPGSSDLYGTIAQSILGGAGPAELVQNVALALIPVGQFAAPLKLAGDLLSKLWGGDKKTLPVSAWVIDSSLGVPETTAQMKGLADGMDRTFWRMMLEDLGRPAPYLERLAELEPKPLSFDTTWIDDRREALDAWRAEVGVAEFKWGKLVGWKVTQEQYDAAGLTSDVVKLREQELALWKPYHDWTVKVDSTYRDNGTGGLEELLSQPKWKAQTLYWRVRYEIRQGGPSPELLKALGQAVAVLYEVEDEPFPGATAASILPLDALEAAAQAKASADALEPPGPEPVDELGVGDAGAGDGFEDQPMQIEDGGGLPQGPLVVGAAPSSPSDLVVPVAVGVGALLFLLL